MKNPVEHWDCYPKGGKNIFVLPVGKNPTTAASILD